LGWGGGGEGGPFLPRLPLSRELPKRPVCRAPTAGRRFSGIPFFCVIQFRLCSCGPSWLLRGGRVPRLSFFLGIPRTRRSFSLHLLRGFARRPHRLCPPPLSRRWFPKHRENSLPCFFFQYCSLSLKPAPLSSVFSHRIFFIPPAFQVRAFGYTPPVFPQLVCERIMSPPPSQDNSAALITGCSSPSGVALNRCVSQMSRFRASPPPPDFLAGVGPV